MLSRINASPMGNQFVELAGGFRERSYAYQVLVEWGGEPRMVEALTLDGNPLIGNALWVGEALQLENFQDGEVLFEPL